jgi:hypothetical protein
MIRRTILVGVAALALAGCVTAKNTLSTDDVATMRFAGVDVSFAPTATIWWGDGERAYAASKGRPATDSDELAKTPEAQAYLRNTIASKVKGAMERNLAGALTGSRPVRVRITVKGVNIPSAIQRVLVGGHHAMTADVTLVDARTGAVLLPYEAQTAQAMAGQGIAGAIIDSAVAGNPIDRVTVSFANQYRDWLVRQEMNVARAN